MYAQPHPVLRRQNAITSSIPSPPVLRRQNAIAPDYYAMGEDEQQMRHSDLARAEEANEGLWQGWQDAYGRPWGGKRRKYRKSRKSRKSSKSSKFRKVGGGRKSCKSCKSRKVGGGRKSRKVTRSRR